CSPLTRMRSALEVELAGTDPPRSREAQDLLEDVVEMQRMVEDLLHLARADEGGVEVAFNPLDLDDLVIREARRIRSHERVEVDLTGVSGAHVLGDAGQLTRAIRNLLDNAERHAASRIALSLRESDGMATLVVADDGPGVAPDDAERVFERFSRLDEARTTGIGGTGLGLAIARDIVERHGGSLFLASVGSPGATFELRLPLAS
ncbi:MAG: sensor histidine kinase, partial [Acidimicrobiia bacterium]